MPTGKKWDYTMTGDELECVVAYAKSVASSVWMIMCKKGLRDKNKDLDYQILKKTWDNIFEDKTKTKKEWEDIIERRKDVVMNKFNLGTFNDYR